MSKSADSPSPKALANDLRLLAERLSAGGTLPEKTHGVLASAVELAMDTIQAPKPKPVEVVPGDGPIHIWSDGSCAPNPGPGGWGAILEANGERREYSGGARNSTNNIMEMTGAIEALGHTPEGATVHVTTDSEYLRNGITKWINGWKKNGWLTAEKKPVKNQEQWRALDALVAKRTVHWHWVAGHSGHPENERCDVLANEARMRLTG